LSDHSTNSVKILLLRVAKGDEVAFGQIFTLYHNQLADFILHITESVPLTQEIVQDVFLKVWMGRSSLNGIHSFKAYLFVIARNHAFNCLKQIAREETRKKQWIKTVLQQTSNIEEEEDAVDAGNLVEAAVALLPSQQKKVYNLSRKHGLKQEEIALELNISIETVKKHMVLAIRGLKNYLRSHIGLFSFLLAFLAK
jgi:RNA polymerase sigma-70 factor (family 1)